MWRTLSQKVLINTYSLQYDLDKEKQQLAVYSTRLEQLVEERTREMNKSEIMFRSLFENAQDGILITDPKGTILNLNRALCEIHGFDRNSLIGTNIALLETGEDRTRFSQKMVRVIKGEPLLYETTHYRKDGSRVSLEVTSKLIEVEDNKLIQSFCRDITDKKKMQAQLMHSQKMDSIGQLAGGIAHDFNNILTSILGFAEIILHQEDVSESVLSKVRIIEKVSRQAAQMVSKLLSFARRGNFEPVPFDINKVINDTLEMMSRLIPSHIEIEKNLEERIPAVSGDVTQMEQVIMNLIINARDAMPEKGTLKVSTSLMELGPRGLAIDAQVERGTYVNITVSDTGKGIAEEHLSHIFEPFFTTKEKGKGTGLGLAMVYGIVKEHKGYITVSSRLGEGTVFNVYLPVSDRPGRVEEPSGEWVTGDETILAIDDESPVLEFIKETLKARGFKVIATDNSVQGLRLYQENHNKISLVITDMLMPVLNGRELIEGITAVNPMAKIIAITGFNADPEDHKPAVFLRKPFSGGKLLLAVREALDSGIRSGN
ncbi:MAG: PAS domain S-box protein [Nitrospiraceae bacterium]|nr:PAS domain S-box protein [Nitrospiraceae bacterium]